MVWLALVIVVLSALSMALWWRNRPNKLPASWPLAMRKVFTQQEQQAFTLLRSAFPEHAVLVKLQVSRFVQLTDKRDMKYWFGLLTPLYVTFAICRIDGKMLAVIDMDTPQNPGSRSGYTLKRRAFEACKLMYLRYDLNSLPSARAVRISVLGETAGDVPANAASVSPSAVGNTAVQSSNQSQSANAVTAAVTANEPVMAGHVTTPIAALPDLKALEEQKRSEAAARAEQERAAAVKQLNELVKDKQRQLRSTDDQSWEADSIIGRDSFLRPDSRIDNVDVPLH
jgi:Protein of unknown function (DUF2726)